MKNACFIFVFIFCAIQLFGTNRNDYLVAYWDFETLIEGKLKDMSGNNHNLDRVGNLNIISGKIGKCMRFNGNAHLELVEDYFLEDECNLTIEGWFKFEADPKDRYQLFCISDGRSFYDPITFQFYNSKPWDFAFEDTKSGMYVLRSRFDNFDFQFRQNRWYFLTTTLCYDGNISTMKIYIDGNLIETVSIRSDMFHYGTDYTSGKLCPNYDNEMHTTIGAVWNYSPWHWIGLIDEMKIFKTCLTEDEIIEEYGSSCQTFVNFYLNSKANGDAIFDEGSFRLNNSNSTSVGSLFSNTPIPVSNSFDAQFIFSIDSLSYNNNTLAGSGFAFVIQNESNSEFGNTGKGLGYQGINSCLVIEYDQFNDLSNNDENSNHIAVQYSKYGAISSKHDSNNTLTKIDCPISFIKNGIKEYHSRIIYNGIQQTLTCYLSDSSDFDKQAPVFTLHNFRLENYVSTSQGDAYVGFTASSNNTSTKYYLKDWSICADFLPPLKLCDSSMFVYQGFDKSSGLALDNHAMVYGNSINLTQNSVNSYGSAYRDRLVPLSNGFKTSFAFKMCNADEGTSHESGNPGADGIAFVIKNYDLSDYGNIGGGIGYEGLHNCLAIEFDMFNNDAGQLVNNNDPNANHLAVFASKDEVSPVHSSTNTIGETMDIPMFKSDCFETYYADIIYSKENRTLEIYVENNQNLISPRLVLTDFELSNYIDLAENTKAYIGFTAATGTAFQEHRISNWAFCPAANDSAVSVDDAHRDTQIRLYPNPAEASTYLTFPYNSSADIRVEIFNSIGGLVESLNSYQIQNDVCETLINISNYAQGLYLIKIKSGDKFYTKNLIVNP